MLNQPGAGNRGRAFYSSSHSIHQYSSHFIPSSPRKVFYSLIGVLVFIDSVTDYHKLLGYKQYQCNIILQFYVRSPIQGSVAKIKVFIGLCSFLQVLEKHLISSPFQCLMTPSIPCLVSPHPAFYLQSSQHWDRPFSH